MLRKVNGLAYGIVIAGSFVKVFFGLRKEPLG